MDKSFVRYILERKKRKYDPMDEKLSLLTLDQLYSMTDTERRDVRAKNQGDYITIPEVWKQGMPSSTSQLDPNIPATFKFKVRSGKTNKDYNAFINFQEKLNSKSKVTVSCSCADFQYRCGAVLHTASALFNPTSFPSKMFDLPNKTNPNYREFICKHLVACCDSMINSGILKG